MRPGQLSAPGISRGTGRTGATSNSVSCFPATRSQQQPVSSTAGGRAGQARGAKNAWHQAAVHAWTGEKSDPAVFTREILPGLRQLPIGELVAVSGLSTHYCSMIRLGKKVPHPRHWAALRELSGSPVPD